MSFAALQREHEELKSAYERVNSELESQRAEQERLKLVIKNLQYRLFGKSSERRSGDDPRQGSLFELGERKHLKQERSVSAHTRQMRERFPEDEEAPEGTFPEHLPRIEEVIDEKPQGVAEQDLEQLPDKITERLGATPEQHFVKRIVRKVYKQKQSGKITTAPAPGHVLDRRCKVDATFLILMAVKKYLWHQPIYRQQQQLKLEGIRLSRDSMVRWMIELGNLFRPIAEAQAELIRQAPIVHCDETPFVVGKRKKGQKKRYQDGYLWPILSPNIGVAFLYRPTRRWCEVIEVLKDFRGVLVTDAYDGYEDFVDKTKILWQLCWMHIRRNFIEAESSNPELAKEALEFIRELYRIEEEIRWESIEKRTELRLRKSKSILEEFKVWLEEHSASPAVLTDPPMAKAISYVLKRWEAACLFVYDGEIPIDNGADERALKQVKLGAKNWLHCASEEGAEISAVFYTLIGSALMQGIHPYYYFIDLCKRLDDPALCAEDLVPVRWKERYYEEAVPEEFRNLIRTGSPFVGDPNRAVKNAAA
jgi:transposase